MAICPSLLYYRVRISENTISLATKYQKWFYDGTVVVQYIVNSKSAGPRGNPLEPLAANPNPIVAQLVYMFALYLFQTRQRLKRAIDYSGAATIAFSFFLWFTPARICPLYHISSM